MCENFKARLKAQVGAVFHVQIRLTHQSQASTQAFRAPVVTVFPALASLVLRIFYVKHVERIRRRNKKKSVGYL